LTGRAARLPLRFHNERFVLVHRCLGAFNTALNLDQFQIVTLSNLILAYVTETGFPKAVC
jgi:hypothetical protein